MGAITVLLAEDHAVVREATAEIVDHQPDMHVVGQAGTGEEALELHRAHGRDIDLTILDLGMPGMGGEACLRKLLGMHPGLKVIIATGYSHDAQARRSLEAGACGFLGKPFGMPEMLKLARQVLDQDPAPSAPVTSRPEDNMVG